MPSAIKQITDLLATSAEAISRRNKLIITADCLLRSVETVGEPDSWDKSRSEWRAACGDITRLSSIRGACV
jgi:hypothetical protein